MIHKNIETALEARDKGINQAVTHADEVSPNWSAKAFELLRDYLQTNSGEFMAEDVRAHAAMVDFPLPPSNRAWGGVFMRAVKEGIIKSVGVRSVTNPKAHRAFANVYLKNAA